MNIGIIALLPCIENIIPLTCSNEKKEKKKRKKKALFVKTQAIDKLDKYFT